MAKIIVAFPDKEMDRKVCEALETGGFQVFRTCMTGNEVMRAFNQCQDGILVCGVRFPDRTAESLAWDLGQRALILVLGRPEQLDTCEHPSIFRRALPVNRAELSAAVDMLQQLHSQRMPHRGREEEQVLRDAKVLLIRRFALTEPDAHRALQRYSMKNGIRILDCARRLLDRTLAPDELMR